MYKITESLLAKIRANLAEHTNIPPYASAKMERVNNDSRELIKILDAEFLDIKID